MRIAPIALALVSLLTAFAQTGLPAAEATLELRDGDRVTLLGAGFVERLQQTGYLETTLTTRRPELNVTYRNLGWSGDTVWGEARGVFGGQPQGFERLLSDLKLTDPTLILVAYGNNEAHAGEAGLPRFEQGLEQLLDKLNETGARVALLSPLERENVGPPLPDPTAYNHNVRLYAAAIERIANERDLKYIELNPLAQRDEAYRPVALDQRLTTDSLTLTDYGAWLAADRIAEALGLPAVPLNITIDVNTQKASAEGGTVSAWNAAGEVWKFECQAEQLPYLSLPDDAPRGAEDLVQRWRVQIQGLPAEATYRLLIDDEEVARGSGKQWSEGISLAKGPDHLQTARVRGLIATKNELFFNRYRPQNETYLFLFRKHEQGNNAVEIPQFDPLIESKEHEIADWRSAKKRRYTLEKID